MIKNNLKLTIKYYVMSYKKGQNEAYVALKKIIGEEEEDSEKQ